MSPSVVNLSYRAIIDYLGGQFEEYERLVSQAIELNVVMPVQVKCKYIKNGIKIDAFIDWQTGVITNVNGEIIRRGTRC